MPATAYVNGAYVLLSEAAVAVEDRGYQFADGAYEVCWVEGGRVIDLGPHLDRLERSLESLRTAAPMSRAALSVVIGEVIRRNRLSRGFVYLQITRGVAARNHLFPQAAESSLVVTARRAGPPQADVMAEGVAVIGLTDIRWKRCDIKAVALLPNVLGKQAAADQGAFEAWQIDPESGVITEGAASNAWIIDSGGVLRTHPAGPRILGGIVRDTVLRLAADLAVPLAETAFSTEEIAEAREAFLTSTTNFVLPVTGFDGRPIADGRPGSNTLRLAEAYAAHITAQAAA